MKRNAEAIVSSASLSRDTPRSRFYPCLHAFIAECAMQNVEVTRYTYTVALRVEFGVPKITVTQVRTR